MGATTHRELIPSLLSRPFCRPCSLVTELRRESLEMNELELVQCLQKPRPLRFCSISSCSSVEWAYLQLGHLSLHHIALALGFSCGSALSAHQQYAQQGLVKRRLYSAFRNRASDVSPTNDALDEARPRHRADRAAKAEDEFCCAAQVEGEARDRALQRSAWLCARGKGLQ